MQGRERRQALREVWQLSGSITSNPSISAPSQGEKPTTHIASGAVDPMREGAFVKEIRGERHEYRHRDVAEANEKDQVISHRHVSGGGGGPLRVANAQDKEPVVDVARQTTVSALNSFRSQRTDLLFRSS